MFFDPCVSFKAFVHASRVYLASGCSYKDLHYTYRVGVSTIRNIIREVTQSIWNNLCTEFMALPDTSDKWEKIADGFWRITNFPYCLGAVDGKHIREKKPDNSASNFNYKEYFSIVLLAVVDSEYRFVYLNVGSYGKDCDSSILKESVLWKKLIQGTLNIPTPRPLGEQSQVNVPSVFIGDEGFGLHNNLCLVVHIWTRQKEYLITD
ncbi:hypothetical protein NQ314_010526 [Rhamnusium bicolor]|uniref:DDE Tnp4 domain-containing protein n=1 Tax=Rhamnusium bicolor TaxID=1586634 RepID=A0AAV8XPZ8_9CUCU|nr:hypothetical protein NQ314_010526 [Rhamnusium bicolor]